MSTQNTPLLLIPCKRDSQRLPGKNFREMCGKPLWRWTWEAAKDAWKQIGGEVWLSTDAPVDRVSVIERPAELCQPDTPMGAVVRHAVETLDWQGPVITLQPTSPLRWAGDIVDCWKRYKDSRDAIGVESCVNVGKHQRLLTTNGAIWITPNYLARSGQMRLTYTGVYYEMPASRSIDIDTEEDWQIAEALLKQRLSGNS